MVIDLGLFFSFTTKIIETLFNLSREKIRVSVNGLRIVLMYSLLLLIRMKKRGLEMNILFF